MERKASDIILDLESEIKLLIQKFELMEFNNKILSNKNNILISKLDAIEKKIDSIESKLLNKKPITHITAMAPEIVPNQRLQELNQLQESFEIEQEPKGIRRNSRQNSVKEFSGPIQVPGNGSVKFISNSQNNDEEFTGFKNQPKTINKDNIKKPEQAKEVPILEQKELVNDGNLIKVSQRVFNENGKAEFFADVQIQELPSLNKIKGTRTSGVGLWNVMIPKGNYRVSIKTKQSINAPGRTNSFDLNLDGSSKDVELNKLII